MSSKAASRKSPVTTITKPAPSLPVVPTQAPALNEMDIQTDDRKQAQQPKSAIAGSTIEEESNACFSFSSEDVPVEKVVVYA